ncbi:MAG TPA: hypothetical protein VI790_03825 [Candidatus Nanoarchaeia archaeon]|nr:hypothetical protein [Candidatus Nanoarchaeia archaeon]
MTKKDYVLIANAIKSAKERPDYPKTDKLEIAVSYLAVDLQDDNLRFDRIKFIEACGYKAV